MYVRCVSAFIFCLCLTVRAFIDDSATLRFGTIYPTAVEVFVSYTCHSVTTWTIQYRETGNDATINSVSTEPSRISAARVTGLTASTQYEFRVRASQIYGATSVTEAEYPYPDWSSASTITTDMASIFGKVLITDAAYSPAYNDENSVEWNASLAKVQDAYLTTHSIPANRVTALWIERSDDKPLVHYRVKVNDTTLPSATNYSIAGSALSNCVINNGGTAPGTTHIASDPFVDSSVKHTIWYENPASTCAGQIIVMRYMDVAPEDADAFPVYLNLASPTSSVTSEEDGLAVISNGELRRDDNVAISQAVSRGIFVGLTPRILVKDCLNTLSGENIFSELFGFTDYFDSSTRVHVWEKTTPYPTKTLSETGITCNSDEATTITCSMPTVSGGIKYELLNGDSATVLATTNENDFNCSSTVQMTASNLIASTTYIISFRVTFRNSDGTTSAVTSAFTRSVTTMDATTTVLWTTTMESDTTLFDATTTPSISTTPTLQTTRSASPSPTSHPVTTERAKTTKVLETSTIKERSTTYHPGSINRCKLSDLLQCSVKSEKYYNPGYILVFKCPLWWYCGNKWTVSKCLPNGVWTHLRSIKCIDLHVAWIPSHQGIQRYEKADQYVKKALAMQYRGAEMPLTVAEPRSIAITYHLEEWNKEIIWSNNAELCKTYYESVYVTKSFNLLRNYFSIIFRLLTWHYKLNYHLNRIGCLESDECTVYNVPEIVEHFMLHCTRLIENRRCLQELITNLNLKFTHRPY